MLEKFKRIEWQDWDLSKILLVLVVKMFFDVTSINLKGMISKLLFKNEDGPLI